jgi:hypothetical protein
MESSEDGQLSVQQQLRERKHAVSENKSDVVQRRSLIKESQLSAGKVSRHEARELRKINKDVKEETRELKESWYSLELRFVLHFNPFHL